MPTRTARPVLAAPFRFEKATDHRLHDLVGDALRQPELALLYGAKLAAMA
jgi:hypothetical protein